MVGIQVGYCTSGIISKCGVGLLPSSGDRTDARRHPWAYRVDLGNMLRTDGGLGGGGQGPVHMPQQSVGLPRRRGV